MSDIAHWILLSAEVRITMLVRRKSSQYQLQRLGVSLFCSTLQRRCGRLSTRDLCLSGLPQAMLCFDRVQTALGIRLHVWAAILFKGNKVKRLHTLTRSSGRSGDNPIAERV